MVCLRAMRWAALWLRWLQSVLAFFRGYGPLSRQTEAIAQRWLSEVANLIALYIVIAAAHRIADLIFEQLTGIRGAFSTRIVYVNVEGTPPSQR